MHTCRKKIVLKYSLLILFSLMNIEHISSESELPVQSNNNLKEAFTRNNADFTTQLFTKISKLEGENKNIVIGPYSIQSVLTLAYLGTDNETAEEFVSALRLISNKKDQVSSVFKDVSDVYEKSPNLKIANKIYVNELYDINEDYRKNIIESFHSDVDKVDFENPKEAANIINEWVDKKTNHKINEIITSDNINADTSVLLINAAHFKADWASPFKKELTLKDKFYYKPNEFVEVDMMNRRKVRPGDLRFNFGIFHNLGARIVEMPYKKSDFSMVIILPEKDKSINEIEENLKQFNLMDLVKQLGKTYVQLSIPKFKIEFETSLNTALQQLGIKKAFQGGVTEIVNAAGKISDVRHKAYIEVDETSTEAAAVSSVGIVNLSAPLAVLDPEEFKANRPFIYMIKDKKGIHFIGKYTAAEKL